MVVRSEEMSHVQILSHLGVEVSCLKYGIPYLIMQVSTTPDVIEDDWHGALRLRLDAPSTRNAVTLPTARWIRRCLAERPERMVVLGSADPGTFCSGADIKVDDATRKAISEELYECYRLMLTRPGPVVAVVEGPAVGGGAQLATAADLRIAGPGARFRWPGPGHGLAVGAWILSFLVGRSRALDLMLTGGWLDACEAVAAGIIARVEADPWAAAAEVVRELASLDGTAVGNIKAVSAEPGILSALDAERQANASWDGRAPAGDRSASFSWEEWSRASWRRHLGERPLPDLTGTLASAAWEAAARHPSKLAVSIDGHSLTFAELTAGAVEAAGWLQTLTGRGDRVLLAAPTSPDWVQLYLGALAAGRVVVLANPSLTATELQYLAADAEVSLVVAGGPTAATAAGLDVAMAEIRSRPWADVAPAGSGSVPVADLGGDDVAILAYTSGTTGRPKGVPLTHRQLMSSILSALTSWRWSPDDVVVHGMPLYHQHGLGALHATFCTGSSAGILSHFDEAGIAAEARRLGATVMFGVPAIYRRLVDRIEFLPAADVSALRALRLRICGSAPLDEQLAEKMAARIGIPVLVRYGLTESGLDVSQPLDAPRSATIGIPLPGVELRLASGGVPVDPGREGEIQLRGLQVFTGYWHDAEATAGAMTADGWFRTGDIAILDSPAGQLVIRGRSKELIITGGLNVHPREVELALESHPAVKEVAVGGLADPTWGEQVTAWVVRAAGASVHEADLLAHARTVLAAYKCPKQLFFVDSLPRTAMGKIQRNRLQPPDQR